MRTEVELCFPTWRLFLDPFLVRIKCCLRYFSLPLPHIYLFLPNPFFFLLLFLQINSENYYVCTRALWATSGIILTLFCDMTPCRTVGRCSTCLPDSKLLHRRRPNENFRTVPNTIFVIVCTTHSVFVHSSEVTCKQQNGFSWKLIAMNEFIKFMNTKKFQSVGVIRTTLADASRTSMTNKCFVHTVLRYFWWWTVDLSETCRVLYQINMRNSASRWLLL